ncbi:MAG: DUF5916 domain-containing protein [Gemmatimonadota bacterium]
MRKAERLGVRGTGRALALAACLLVGTAGAGPGLRGQTATGLVSGRGQGAVPVADVTAPANAGPKVAEAVPVDREPIRVDGRLDDAAWSRARFFSDFLQKEPNQGEPPTERTEVAFLFDDDALYVGARMYSSDPDEIAALMTRRDQQGKAELLAVYLDTFHDRRTAYSFAVTAAGVRVDWYHPQDNEFRRDVTFDPVWETRTRVDSLGWTAEMKIPFSQLRFNDLDEQRWGLNVERWIPARNEDIFWVYVPRDETGWASRFGTLTGVAGIRPSRRIELLPFVATDARITSPSLVNDADPFHGTSELTQRVGANLKMGLGPNLTLDATVNPDFGQVNFDPAVVNLSGFETIFDEQRPFFTEGNQIFAGNGKQGPRYFFSRRIGAPPHGFASGDFTDPPEAATILGAAKVTGRLESGLSVGVLGAVTSSESARTFRVSDATFGREKIEPSAGWGVVRLQQELGENASTVGLTLTGLRRGLSDGQPLAGLLSRQAYTGGGDFLLRMAGGKYELNGHFGASYVQGDSLAIQRIQRSFVHRFDRPDQDHVSLDPSRTSLLGFSGSLQFSKNSGRHWLYNAGIWADSPNWELNDVGQLGLADDIQSWGGLTYRETEVGRLFRNYRVNLNGGNGWNFGGVHKNSWLGLSSFATLKNFMWVNVFGGRNFNTLSDNLTRGGPLMGQPGNFWAGTGFGNNFSAKTRWSANVFWNDRNRGHSLNLNARLAFEPGDRWRVSLAPGYSRRTNRLQYFATMDRASGRTFGKRYVFSTVEQSQLSANLSLNYSFSPDLNLDFSAQPFSASGRFSEFGELPRAGSFGLRRYGTDGTTIREQVDPASGTRFYSVTDGAESFTLGDADFNSLSFRSNLVLRWEFKPGSTLFFVWRQDRSRFANTGDFVTPGSLFDSFSAAGTNTLSIKFSYWMPMS